jgi:hypothetical protein
MVLASVRLRGIHPPDNIQNGGRPGGGGMPLISALARRQHSDDESWRDSDYAFLAESTYCVSLFCDETSIRHDHYLRMRVNYNAWTTPQQR